MPPSRRRAITAATTTASIIGLLGTLYYLDIPSFLQQKVKMRKVTPRCYSLHDQPSFQAFKTLIEQMTLKETYPLAKEIRKNIPVYDCSALNPQDPDLRDKFRNEIHHILSDGPGVLVLQNFFPDLSPIDTANTAYEALIAREANSSAGDHFAAAGTNSRIWNSFSKHCIQDPSSFLQYYSNPLFRTVSEAYLGPAYKLTAQVNIVRPGGTAQVCHRDYHLGFQTLDDVAKWPRAQQVMSQFLTLQGAVAHTDMPLESGPTRFLPYSQLFEEGFMAFRKPEFNEYFLQNHVSLPLRKGDAVFFSPALFHAAGENRTQDFSRSANLIQVSSAFGKTMETIDSLPLIEATYDALREKYGREGWSEEVCAFVRAVAEGYPFPTNLDRRPPAPGGMAPKTEQDVLWVALEGGMGTEEVLAELRSMRADSAA